VTPLWRRTISLVNGHVAADMGPAQSLRFASRILAIDERPRRRDTVIDLEGAFVLPGLINSHDHLELNHYGRLKFRERYENASEWIDDMRPRIAHDAPLRAGQAHPLASRLFVGALKNLLAGVTTVAHHNPFYRELRRAVPLRLVRRYGWAHSFFLERGSVGARGEKGGDVASCFRSTPADAPFFIHICEGVDDRARREIAQLDELGCLKPNAVLVHGVGIDSDGWSRVARSGAGLVWCPASNMFLFGRTAEVRRLLDPDPGHAAVPSRVALGTDSRLTGSSDLLGELRAAAESRSVSPDELFVMVTRTPSEMLRLPEAGRIRVGMPADLVVIPRLADLHAASLLETTRRDVRLVAIGGRPLVADPSLADVFRARSVQPCAIRVDATPKLADPALARQIASCPIIEPGVEAGAHLAP
jgi:cytosine/adenosine deaminase-related metal-dependent hydrolase